MSIINDNFREKFKHYKQRVDPVNLENVIDFDKSTSSLVEEVNLSTKHSAEHDDLCKSLGLKSTREWKAYSHKQHPGLVFICNPFLDGYQRYWVKRCLSDYPNLPNVCNLDAHITRTGEGNVWKEAQLEKLEKPNVKTNLEKLRWATMGYHHNWETKVYDTGSYNPMPADATLLASAIAGIIGWSDYMVEAAIVNFYHLKSTLAPHTDHSEYERNAPLISISFGQAAIFLLGGKSKCTEPTAMFIRSGDIVLMSAEARLCFHAVPKIITPTPDQLLPECFAINPQHWENSTDQSTENATAQSWENSTDQSTENSTAQSRENSTDQSTENSTDQSRENSASKEISTTTALSSDSKTELSENKRLCNHKNQDIQTVVKRTSSGVVKPTGSSCIICETSGNIAETLQSLDWHPFAEYLSGARINLNIRQVFPSDTKEPARERQKELRNDLLGEPSKGPATEPTDDLSGEASKEPPM